MIGSRELDPSKWKGDQEMEGEEGKEMKKELKFIMYAQQPHERNAISVFCKHVLRTNKT